MKKIILFLPLVSLSFALLGQQKVKLNDKQELREFTKTFMKCIIQKDSLKFYSLFHEDPVSWVGVFKEKTQAVRVEKGNATTNYFSDTYKNFFRMICDPGLYEEKFYNVIIIEDGCMASVTFDYNFWMNGKKQNWGKESWCLIKANGQWKITSVVFSLEMEEINPEPKHLSKVEEETRHNY